MKLPRPFFAATEYVLNTDLKKIFEKEPLDVEKLEKLITEAKKRSVKIDKTTIEFVVSSWITSVVDSLSQQPDNLELFEQIDNTLGVLEPLSLTLDFWKAQNRYFSIGKDCYNTMKEKAESGDSIAKRWIEDFLKLGHFLNVKI